MVIDAGPDFRYQMLRENVKNIRAILLTHEHKDHIGGLDDIRAFNWVNKTALDVYADERTKKAVKREFSYAFADFRYPGVPEINLHTINGEEVFYIDEIKIIPIPVWHHKLSVLGFRIENFAYITDTNNIPEESLKKLEGIEYLVINALRKEKHLSHFNLEEAIEIAQTLKVKKAWLTHIGHQMGLYEEVVKELPPEVELAYDGMQFIF
ncbi:MAG: MBL fold metallo-hydrolase [Odoribacter sp.]|nr:MBL fold metallo-hydrolase [Odoribacter sp.]